jgi:TP901-1 family phage major tail protein
MASAINGTNIVLYEYDSNAIYYFNGGTAQGTFDSIVCKELSRSQVGGTSVTFTKTGAGTIASFITDALDPGVTTIPAGTWTFSAYYSILTAFAGAQVQYELYKYNGSVATLLFTSSATTLTATSTTLYTTAMTVTQTTISATDRLLIKVNYAGTTTNQITLYTQASNLAQVTTTIPLGTPMGASTSCTFESSTEQIEVTSQTSAWFREFKNDVSSWTVSCDGFVALSGYSYLALMQKQLDRASIDVRFSIDNDNADGSDTYGYSVVSGTANITSISLSAPVEGASTYSLSLQGTGAFAISGTQVINGGSTISTSSVNSYSYTAAGGETTVTFVGAIGSTCMSVTRGGVEVRIINTSGVPTGENVTFNTATGIITFASARALESDEFIRAIFA